MNRRSERVRIGDLGERYAKLRLHRPSLLGELRRSLVSDGLRRALVVNRCRDGHLEVLDGFKRLGLLRELGHGEVEVEIVSVDEVAAHALILSSNARQAGLSEIEEAWIVESLVRGQKLTQKRVAEIVGREKSWVCRRLLLAERLDAEVQRDLRLGLVSYSVARELGRLPRGNQAELGEAVGRHGLSSRQCAALVERWVSSEPGEARRELIADPLRFVGEGARASFSSKEAVDPRLSAVGEGLRQRLVRVERSVAGCCAMLREHPPASLCREDVGILAAIGVSVYRCAVELVERSEELARAAGGLNA